MKKPELLSPAGTLKSMRYAFAYGADAVYAGQPRYSLRARNNEFKNEKLAEGIQEAHQWGKRFFVALNSMPHNAKVKTFIDDVAPVIEMKPDALIMADPGLMMMVREKWPDVPIHLSVQMNTVNYASVKFWESFGVERIVLSRELSLDEIEEIRQECPNTELEVFVHGALCIAYSGRCLLSGYFNHRDPNQGTCTNSCRWNYKTHQAVEDETGDSHLAKEVILSADILNNGGCGDQERHPLADRTYLLEEANRPGEYMPIMEDEHGTYIMNSKDLRAVEHVKRLTEIGVDCFKIEGRTKSHYYAARTAQVYRQAIDDAAQGKDFDDKLLGILANLANRGYTDGFYERHHTHEYQNYIDNASNSYQQQFVAEAIGVNVEEGYIEVDVKNRFEIGDRIEVLMPDNSNQEITITEMTDLKGNPVEVAAGSSYQVRIPIENANEDMGKALLARFV
jgi:putative protease